MRIFVPVCLGLFILNGAVFGQFKVPNCVTAIDGPPILRSEGMAELVGDILLNCTGGTPAAAGATVPAANITISLNTQVTSRILPNQSSEALLIIDDPGASSNPNTPQLGCINPICPLVANATGVPLGTTGFPNLYPGIQTGANQVTFFQVPILPPAQPGGSRLYRFTNIRANVNALSATMPSAATTNILGNITVSGGVQLPIANPQVSVGFGAPGLGVGVFPGSWQYCPNFYNSTFFSELTQGVPSPANSSLTWTERLPLAFRAQGSTTQNIPGFVYNTEGGFVPTVSSGLSQSIGVATRPTGLSATITGLPSGTQLLIPQTFSFVTSSGASVGTAMAMSKNSVVSGNNYLLTPDSSGCVRIEVWVESRNITNTGLATLSLPLTLQSVPGATIPSSALPFNIQTDLGFIDSGSDRNSLYAPSSTHTYDIPAFHSLNNGGAYDSLYIPHQVLGSAVPCVNSGSSLGTYYNPTPTFFSVLPLSLSFLRQAVPEATATPPNTTLIVPRVSNVGLVSTLLPANVTVTKDPSATWLNVTLNQNVTPVTAFLSVNSAASGVHATTLQFSAPGVPSVSIPVTYTVAAGPWFTEYGFDHSGSYVSGVVAPGEPFVIFGGDSFGPPTLAPPALDANGRAVTTLGGTQVLFDGVPAPLYYSVDNNGAGQVAGFAPFGLDGKHHTVVQVVYNGVTSPPVALDVLDAVPGLFTADSSGGGQGSILNQNASINGPNNPEAAGNLVVLFGGGAGQTTPSGRDGALAGAGAPVAVLKLPVKVFIDGIQATDIPYAGPAPGIVEGVFQIDVRIPAGVRHNANVPVLVQIEDKQTQPGVTLATK